MAQAPINPQRTQGLDASANLVQLVADLLAGNARSLNPAMAPAILEAARSQGMKAWLAWQAMPGGLLHVDNPETQNRLRDSLHRAAMAKLAGDAELCQLFGIARERDIRLLLFKGEALARHVFPEPATRPTADFDLLVEPSSLPAMQQVLKNSGYRPVFPYHGMHLFAEQYWTKKDPASGRYFNVDLHWDISNRRYYRLRLGFDSLYRQSVEVRLQNGKISIPSPTHSLMIACVHLAGLHPGDPLQLKWLLDIHLLLNVLDERQWEDLEAAAQRQGLARELRDYTALTAARLGPSRHTGEAAVQQITPARIYRWTCDHRWFDLLHYAWRLPNWRERASLWREAWRYLRTNSHPRI